MGFMRSKALEQPLLAYSLTPTLPFPALTPNPTRPLIAERNDVRAIELGGGENVVVLTDLDQASAA